MPTASECTRPGYILLGFSDSASATTAKYKPGDSTGGDITSTTTLYAIWEQITYTVKLSASPSGAGTVSGGGNYYYGDTAYISASANANYKFTK